MKRESLVFTFSKVGRRDLYKETEDLDASLMNLYEREREKERDKRRLMERGRDRDEK